MTDTLADIGEDKLIRLVSELFMSERLVVGIGDDAAIIPERMACNVVAADAMVESVHFDRSYCPPFSVGKKLVAVNLSDMAAMGARGQFATLTVSLPGALEFNWAADMFRGVADAAKQYGLVIAGGDITQSPGPIVLSMSVQGQLIGSSPLLRSGAKPGDSIYVTGALGSAAYGLEQLQNNPAAKGRCVDVFLEPEHQQTSVERLVMSGECHALMDLSDGLMADAEKMAQESQLRFCIDVDRVPVAAGIPDDYKHLALSGGEDYQLLFVCPGKPPVDSTCIGHVESGDPGVYWTKSGAEFPLSGLATYRHFDDM